MEQVQKQVVSAHLPDCLRLEPEKRLCSRFDPCGIAEFPVAKPGKMGMRVLDNCCEDHMM